MPSLLFIWWAFALALTAGFAQGGVLFLSTALGWPAGLAWVAGAQAHGHIQLFGWAGMFALGVGLYFLPRLRGSPPPAAGRVRLAAWVLGGGLALRAISQSGAALAPAGSLQSVLTVLLEVSGVLELLGAVLALNALRRSALAGPPLGSRAALLAVLPWLLLFAGALLLGLALNAAALLTVVEAGSVLVPANVDGAIVHLGFIGMIVPISVAISARTFPLYLRLRIPPQRVLDALFGTLVAGLLLRALGATTWDEFLALLPDLGALLEGVALLGITAALDVPWRRTARRPPGQEEPLLSEHRAAGWLITGAYAWLAFAGVLLVASGLSGFGILPRPPLDAERHALGPGFITLLIFGMGVRLLPGFTGRRVRSPRLVWATVWLGYAAALLRVGPLLLLPGGPLRWWLLAVSGLLGAGAVACFFWNTWRTLQGPPEAPSGAGRAGSGRPRTVSTEGV